MEINFDKLNQDVIRLYREWIEAVNRLEDNLFIQSSIFPYKGIMLKTPYYAYVIDGKPTLCLTERQDSTLVGVFYKDVDEAWRRIS